MVSTMSIEIRAAQLDDTTAISHAFRAQIGVWQRVTRDGRVETLPHDALTVYERWLHGGAWMSIETSAIWLNHLILGAGLARVAFDKSGKLRGYAEAFVSTEADPFGRLLHIHHLMADDSETTRALLTHLAADARSLKCQRMTITKIGNDAPYMDVATLECIGLLRRYTLSARQGNVFYRAVDHPNVEGGQIIGWGMPIGRFGSARSAWETVWNHQFNSIPDIAARKTQRLHMSVAGIEAFLHCQQGLYDPRTAEIAVWSPKPLTGQVVNAVRDWAHREGYRSLIVAVHDDERAALGADADADGYTQETCAITLDET